jgi:hypothetical protein
MQRFSGGEVEKNWNSVLWEISPGHALGGMDGDPAAKMSIPVSFLDVFSGVYDRLRLGLTGCKCFHRNIHLY